MDTTVVALAEESKTSFASGDFKNASRCLARVRELLPDVNIVQRGDGSIGRVTGAKADGDPEIEDLV